MSDFAIPIVDVGRWDDGPDARAEIAARLDQACTEVGFLQLAGHGIDGALIERTLAAVEGFFRSPEADKRRCVPPSPQVNRGWAPLGSESLAYSLGVDAPPDLFEAFNIGHEHDPADPVHTRDRDGFFAPNIWPAGRPGFREALVGYWLAAHALAHRLTAMLAVALELPGDFFERRTAQAPDVMRVNWYERAAGSPAPAAGQQRMGAHTDYGVLTILYADAVPGLEVVAPDGTWTPVAPQPGCLLVNLGDLLSQWTNDRWRSTLHRVVPPPGDATGAALRRSIAFFHEADSDALVSAIPSCVTADRPARYEPVTAGEHLLQKLLGPRELRRSTAASTLGEREGAVRP